MADNAIYRISFRFSLGTDEKKVMAGLEKARLRLWDLLLVKCERYVYQVERGAQGTFHFQGHASLKVKERVSTLVHGFTLAFKHTSFNISACHDENALKQYCMKDDTRFAGPWADKPIYRGADLPHVTQLYDWQRSVVVEIKQSPDSRTINWVYDPDGNNGKTMLAKFLFYHYKYPTFQFADAKDLMNLISKFIGKKAYFFDLTRTKPASYSSRDIYSCLEQIKNGMVQNVKYQTSIDLMDPPHLWVFSNQLPKFENLTADRWKVWTISSKKLEKWVPDPSYKKNKITADAPV